MYDLINVKGKLPIIKKINQIFKNTPIKGILANKNFLQRNFYSVNNLYFEPHELRNDCPLKGPTSS
jgi:spore germination protein GerM